MGVLGFEISIFDSIWLELELGLELGLELELSSSPRPCPILSKIDISKPQTPMNMHFLWFAYILKVF